MALGVPSGIGHDAGLLAHPGRRGPEAPGQVGVVLRGRSSGGSSASIVPARPAGPCTRVLEVVPGDGGDGVGLQPDPGDAGLGRVGRREDDVDGAVGVPRARLAAVDGADDARGVAAVVGTAVDGQGQVDGVAGLDASPGRCGSGRSGRSSRRRRRCRRPTSCTGPTISTKRGRAVSAHRLHLGRHLQDREDPLVGLEQRGLVVRQLLDHAGVGGAHLVEQLGEGRLGLGRHLPPGVSAWVRSSSAVCSDSPTISGAMSG